MGMPGAVFFVPPPDPALLGPEGRAVVAHFGRALMLRAPEARNLIRYSKRVGAADFAAAWDVVESDPMTDRAAFERMTVLGAGVVDRLVATIGQSMTPDDVSALDRAVMGRAAAKFCGPRLDMKTCFALAFAWTMSID